MNKPHPTFSVNECKIKASILLKSLQTDGDQSKRSAKRFQRLSEFQNATCSFIKDHAKHKHALTVIALEKGFASWAELKCQLPFIRG